MFRQRMGTVMGVPSFKSLKDLQLAHRALLQRQRDDGSRSDTFFAEVQDFIRRGRETGRVLASTGDQSAAQGVLDYWAAVLCREKQDVPDSLLVEFDLSAAPELDDADCPYVGLRGFGREDGDRFFGRQRLIAKIVQHLRWDNFVAIVGPQNSGRSSLLRAGLPAFLEGNPETATWNISEVRASLQESIQELAGNEASVLLIDNFYERLTSLPEKEQRAFAADLLRLVGSRGPRRMVVAVLRQGQEDLLAPLPELQSRIQQARISLPPPSAKDLRQAIEGPAELVGLAFEEGVVENVVNDIVGEHAAFSLLQFTMIRLWQRRERNRIPKAAYKAVGAGRSSVVRAAEEFYAALPADRQATARSLLVRLSATDEALSGVSWTALLDGSRDRSLAQELLAGMEAASLLRVSERQSGQRTVKLLHVCLAENWDVLRDCRAQKKLLARRLDLLERRADEWARLREGNEGLLRGRELQDAEAWLDDFKKEEIQVDSRVDRLIKASGRAEASRRNILVAASTAVIMALVATTSIAGWNWMRAEQAVADREQQVRLMQLYSARERVDVVSSEIISKEQLIEELKAAHAGAKGNLRSSTQVSWQRAEQDLTSLRQEQEGFKGLKEEIRSYNETKWNALSERKRNEIVRVVLDAAQQASEGSVSDLFVALYAAAAIPENPELNRTLATALLKYPPHEVLEHPNMAQAWAVAVNDSSHAAIGDKDGVVRLWKLSSKGSNAPIAELGREGQIVNGLSFSPDGRKLAAAYRKGGAVVWQLGAAPQEVCRLRGGSNAPSLLVALSSAVQETEEQIYDVAFSPDGEFLAVASSEHSAQLFDLTRPGCPRFADIRHDAEVFSVAISRNGRLLATGSADGTARLWKIEADRTVTHHHTFKTAGPVFSVALDTFGAALAASGPNGEARIWQVKKVYQPEEVDEPGLPLPRHNGMVGRIAFDRTGKFVATTGADRSAKVSNSRTGELLFDLAGHRAEVFGVAFTADSKYLVTGSLDGTAGVWPLARDVKLDGGRDSVLAAGARRIGARELSAGECRTLLRIGIPAFSTMQSALLKGGRSCPLPYLADREAE